MYEMTADIETTGLDIYKDTPIQLAYCVHLKDELVDEKTIYINPEKPLPEIITKITGITDEILQNKGVSNTEGVKAWQNIIWKYQPLMLIGYNLINFDFPMIQNWINNICTDQFKFPPIIRIYDVMHMVSTYFNTRKWLKLPVAAEKLGIEFKSEDLHDALTDVRLTREVFKSILTKKREEL